MTALYNKALRRSGHNGAGSRRPALGLHVPMAVAIVVALSSAATLTAYDKPLDRQAFTPSVMDFIEVNSEAASPSPQAEAPKAHAMLLRYEFATSREMAATWHPGMFLTPGSRVQPALL